MLYVLVVNPDHIRDRHVPAPETSVIAAKLQELLSPLVYNQLGYYQQLGRAIAHTGFTFDDGCCVNITLGDKYRQYGNWAECWFEKICCGVRQYRYPNSVTFGLQILRDLFPNLPN
jgi:hypothetical protein